MKHPLNTLFYLKTIALLILCAACMSGQTGDSSADSETASGTTDLSDPGTQALREQGDSPAETKSPKVRENTAIYTFSYKATFEFETQGVRQPMVYYLEPDGNYMLAYAGAENGPEAMGMLFDYETEQSFMMREASDDRKIAVKNPMSAHLLAGVSEKDKSQGDAQSRKIGNKTILGYPCDGYEITSSGGLMEIWVTNEAPVGIIGDLSTLNLPTSLADFTPDWGQDAFFLEMTHRNPATNSTVVLKCTDLSKKSLKIDMNDYEIVKNIFQ